jgi:mono/diheme cytochrome c family protein
VRSSPVRLRSGSFVFTACVLTAITTASAQTGLPIEGTGAELYGKACVTCHGRDGKTVSRAALAHTYRVPDFTDCRFAQREADGDWLAIIHEGGPARAFAQMMPAFRDALTEQQIQSALDHIRTFCEDKAWPRGDLNFPKALVTEKAFPEDEVLITTTVPTEGASSVDTKFVYEKRFGSQTQIELILPMKAHDSPGSTGSGWVGGVGDLAFAVKRVLAHNLQRGHIVSATAEVAMPTGNEARGLGGGTGVIEPVLLYGQILPADAFLQVQSGVAVPWKSGVAKEAFWRATFGRSFNPRAFSRTWSPMIEILGARELLRGEPALWDVLPQMQVTLSTRQHIRINAGVRVPLNHAATRSTQVVTYFLWDWYDGSLLGGW